MLGVIIYESKYGATRQYAKWLTEMLNWPVKSANEILKDELTIYDCIVLGTPVYFGKFKLKQCLTSNIRALINKKLFMFIVSATPSDEVEKRNNFIEQNMPAELKPYCKFYFLPGRIIHKKLFFTDKLMLKIAGWFEKDPLKKRALYEDLDGVKKENLVPLVNDISNYLRSTGVRGFDLFCSLPA